MSFAKPLFVLLATVIAPLVGLADQPRGDTSRLATFQDANNHYFALSVQADPGGDYPLPSAYEVVVLVDTSATQTGPVRLESLEVAEELARALPAGAQAALLACDVEAVELSGGLVDPSAPQWETAMARLQKRIPLGTTDLAGALRAAASQFSDRAAQRTIVYIGDGINRSNLLTKSQHRQLVDELIAAKISVSSLAIGPIIDLASLAAISNQTGGIVLSRDEIQESMQSIGNHLAHSATLPVLWIDDAPLPGALAIHFPQRFPPLRIDRDTVVVGRSETPIAVEKLNLQGTVGSGQTVKLTWDLTVEPSNPDLGFLTAIVAEASRDGGISLPALGSVGLRAMSYMLADNATALVKAGNFALKSGDLDAARRIAEEALKQDPNNAEAATLLNAVEQVAKSHSETVPAGKFTQTAAQDDPFGDVSTPTSDDPFAPATAQPTTPTPTTPAPAELAPQAPAQGVVVPDVAAPATQVTPLFPAAPAGDSAVQQYDPTPSLLAETLDAGDLLNEEVGRRQARAQAIEAEVRQSIRNAQEQLRRNPSIAGQVVMELKLLLERIDGFTDTEPALRAQMRSQVSSALQIAALQEAKFNERISHSEAIRSQADQATRLLLETTRQDEALKQLVEQFNYLMSEQRYLEASKDIAPEISRLSPNTPLDNVARVESSLASNEALMREGFERREQGVVDALRGVELAAVPFDGDPPMIYPAPEVWQALSARRKERYAATSLGVDNESEQRISAALKSNVNDIAYNGVPLQQVITGLADDMNIPIHLKAEEIELGGTASVDSAITFTSPPITLRSMLRIILDPLELTYVIKSETLMITTKDDANAEPINRVYPVGDLVVPIMSGGGMMGGMMGGMGGGMMGGMGGGMGGMGGGMMGGMGGGMGGMGGMGGGMGGMGGMFAIPDDSSKSQSKTAQPATSATATNAARTANKPMAVTHASSSGDAESWVNKLHNAADDQQRLAIDEQVRQAVRDRIEVAGAYLEAKNTQAAKAEFEKVIGLVSGLLSAGYPQPWMYHALSLGMEACDYPGSEIKRVQLSSLDFNGDLNAAFKIAEYLARKGLKSEALELLQDLATAQPNRYDVFALALPLAEETQDLDAMRWVCVGILSKAWPAEQASLFNRASLAARATQLRLTQQGRLTEAKVFEEDTKLALRRDIVVRVNWTGQADLDLVVKEPSGSICSLSNPFTFSGGVLLGDVSSSNSPSSIDGFSEYYVCPQGYAGQYDVLVRRVWGSASGGKATVEVYTDYGTEQQAYFVKQLELSDNDALFQVTVQNGHRQQPLVEAELANIRKKQIELGRTVLGQMATPSASSADAEEYAAYRRMLAAAGRGAGPGFGFPIGRGAVGYTPVISTLREGAMLFTTAVVSHDRRYVRITPTPFFNGIGEVFTFNSATGQQGQNQGGNGGFGGGAGGGVNAGGAGGAGF